MMTNEQRAIAHEGAPRQILEVFGGNLKNSVFEKREYTWKDTQAWNGGTAIPNFTFFQNTQRDEQYTDGTFPIPSQSLFITHIGIEHNMGFTVPDAKNQMAYLQHWLNQSSLRFTVESREVLKVWFRDLTKDSLISDSIIAALPTVKNSDDGKVNSYLRLAVPLRFGAGKQVKVEVTSASGLTTAAYSATDMGLYHNYGLTTLNFGNGVQLYMKGYRFNESS